jgi:hypothetical protein
MWGFGVWKSHSVVIVELRKGVAQAKAIALISFQPLKKSLEIDLLIFHHLFLRRLLYVTLHSLVHVDPSTAFGFCPLRGVQCARRCSAVEKGGKKSGFRWIKPLLQLYQSIREGRRPISFR